jgi:N-methylhydantoinase B
VRHYGVILDWDSGEVFPKTTDQFRAMLRRRMTPHWQPAEAAVPG